MDSVVNLDETSSYSDSEILSRLESFAGEAEQLCINCWTSTSAMDKLRLLLIKYCMSTVYVYKSWSYTAPVQDANAYFF